MSQMRDTTDHEILKGIIATESRLNKTDGFQGCVNCNDGGYYLQQYSKEVYCQYCEIKNFPERFRGCICCRLPLWESYLVICSVCQSGIDSHHQQELGISSSKMTYYWRYRTAWKDEYLENKMKFGDFIRYWEKPTITSSGDQLPRGDDLSHVSKPVNYFNILPTDNSRQVPLYCKRSEWPGFYMGNGIWNKLAYIPQSDENGITIEQPWRIFDETQYK